MAVSNIYKQRYNNMICNKYVCTGQERDPSSAPASPSTLRRISSQGDADEPSKVVLRPARRKLGSSRHGWSLGRGREGGVSQSFSPGDRRSRPIQRLNTPSSALWEKEQDGSPTPSEEGRGETEKGYCGQRERRMEQGEGRRVSYHALSYLGNVK